MKRYGAILADPPWHWRARSARGEGRSAKRHYRVMSLDEIMALPIADLAADDCVLFLWTINSMRPQALDVVRAWGFTYKTVAFTWAKQTKSGKGWHIGTGYWTRQNTEECLLATRGRPKRLSRSVPQLIVAPRREHSRKPDEQYERIERLVDGPYLELFARQRWVGWDVAFSDEADKFIPPMRAA